MPGLRDTTALPTPPRLRAAAFLPALAAAIVALLAGACGSAPRAEASEESPKPKLTPAKPTSVSQSGVAADVRALGDIAGDGFALPLFSPDGRFLAVQTGAVPDLATLLARPGAQRPLASRIAYHRVEPSSITRLGETEPGLVLGRAADALGFLVESPRPDGARWIGRVRWMDGELEWLVRDGNVNAFATLSPDGALAYAARAVADRLFDLVVERRGERARLSGDGVRSLAFPVFSADGARLLVACLRDGVLELGTADPTNSDSLRQTLVRTPLSDRANDETAFQMLAPQGTRDGVDGGDWIFFHPGARSLVRWNASDGPRTLAAGALAAARIDPDRMAILVDGRVRVVRDDDPAGIEGPGTAMLDGIAVPRSFAPVDGTPAVLLLAPAERGYRLLIARVAR
ncbi:MAG: hypothetical protein ACKO0W_03010 [Planctomycetota bacterium]